MTETKCYCDRCKKEIGRGRGWFFRKGRWIYLDEDSYYPTYKKKELLLCVECAEELEKFLKGE